MATIPTELVDLVQSGPMAHVTTLNAYAVVHAHATVEPSDEAWDLLDRLAKVYVSPETTFPAPQRPGFVIRYRVDRIGGVGPWVASGS